MKVSETFGLAGIVSFILAVVIIVIGWVLNIIKLFGLVGEGFDGNGLEVGFRAMGIFFAPVGGILGWF